MLKHAQLIESFCMAVQALCSYMLYTRIFNLGSGAPWISENLHTKRKRFLVHLIHKWYEPILNYLNDHLIIKY